jgi:hypothetical protein
MLPRIASIAGSPALLLPCALLATALLATATGAQELPFQSPLVEVGGVPRYVVAGDFDHDGDADLVTTFSNGSFVVSLQAAPGEWVPGAPVTGGTGLGRATLGDLNGDDTLDLVYLIDGPANELMVARLGNGTGGFGAAMFNLTQTGPADVDLADLDGDGDLDAVVACAASQRVSVLLGDGDGTFAPKVDYGAGQLPISVAVGHWDSDGSPDLAVVGNSSAVGQTTVNVLASNGDGSFAAAVPIVLPSQLFDVETGDFDEDGAADLVVSRGAATLLVLAGDGEGGFGAAQPVPGPPNGRQLSVADLDEDGDDDIATTSSAAPGALLGVTLGHGDGSFEPVTTYGIFGSQKDVLVHDVTGDGDLDLVVPGEEPFTFQFALTVLAGDGAGHFLPNLGIAGDNCDDVAFGDLDADGQVDMVVNSVLDDRISVFPGAGNGHFERPVALSVDQPPTLTNRVFSVAVADLDGDGLQDVVAGVNAFPPFIAVFTGHGDFTFEPLAVLPVPGSPTDVEAVDLEGDGDIDLLATGSTSNTLQILVNGGGGSFAAPVLHATAVQSFRLTTAHMNADDDLDVVLITGNFTAPNFVHVFLGNGDGTVQPALTFPGDINHSSVATGDVDGDGDVDAAVGQGQTGSVLLLLNDGTGFLSLPAVMPLSMSNTDGVVMGDLDLDGIMDLAVSGSPSPHTGFGVVAWLRGTGGGAFAPFVHIKAPSSSNGLAAHDINGDGAPDLAVPTFGDYVSLYTNRLGPWNDLGHALAGGLGLPKQVGEGTLEAFAPFRITLTDARPSASVAHFVGLTTINAPFKGGVLVPLPLLVNGPLFTDAAGDLVLQGPWPGGAEGLTLYMQFVFKDPAGVAGFGLSNAISATIPR